MIDVDHQISAVERTVGDRVLDAGTARLLTTSQSYDATLEELWDACTSAERIPRWFMPNTASEPPLPAVRRRTLASMGSVHRRRPDGSWEGVACRAYDQPDFAGVEKHELIGPADGAESYRVRYFHVPAGGRTALERHPHDHGVVIEHGRALVTLGDERHQLGPGDVVYVGGDELHCFEALGDQPLGFICVVAPAR